MPPSGMMPMIPPGMMRRPQPRPSGLPPGGLTNPGAGTGQVGNFGTARAPGQLGGMGAPQPRPSPFGPHWGGAVPGHGPKGFGGYPFGGGTVMGGGPGGRSILDAILGAGQVPEGRPMGGPNLGAMLGGLTRQPHATMDPGAMGGMLHAFGGGQPMAPARPPLALTNQAPQPAAPAVRRYPAGMTVNGRSSY